MAASSFTSGSCFIPLRRLFSIAGSGPAKAVSIGICILAVAAWLGSFVALHGSGLAWVWQRTGVPEPAVRTACVCAILGLVSGVVRRAVGLYRANFARPEVLTRLDWHALGDDLDTLHVALVL